MRWEGWKIKYIAFRWLWWVASSTSNPYPSSHSHIEALSFVTSKSIHGSVSIIISVTGTSSMP